MTKTMKKTPAILLAGLIAVAAAFAIGALTAQEAHAIEGNGESGNPYIITLYTDLKEFADIVNGENGKTQNQKAWAILTKDIDCSSDTTWVPIGRYTNSGQYSQYTGHFDGRGHTIKNLSNTGIANIENADYQGLFGEIGRGGEVTNVNLEGGKITGNEHIGGIAGIIYEARGTAIAYCRNTGEVSGGNYVGGISGAVHSEGSEITNCCNTGKVSGTAYVGGITGQPDGKITNCYNTGAVSGNMGIGGIVGWNSGNISNCYNIGAVSGSRNVGGISGMRTGETKTITNCYFDTAFCTGVSALGSGDDPDTVKGLDTSQMTGSGAIGFDSMDFRYGDGEDSPWLTRPGGYDSKSGNYYWYYPHLKGFDFDSDGSQVKASDIAPEDWPAKRIVDVEWKESAVYTYNGSEQGPKVLKITVSEESVAAPEGATDILYSKWNDSDWAEPSSDEPTDPGVYKLSYTAGDDSPVIIFRILDPESDYTVEYLSKKETGGSVLDPGDAGDYKAIVTFKNGDSLEKEFKIETASIAATVNGSSTGKTYNGVEQTYTGTVTAASSDTAFDATKFQYTGSAEVKGTKFGEYTAKLAAGNCTYADPNYTVTWTIGDPVKLTIEKAPLTIKAKDQTLTYNGKTQGEGDTVYADAAQIAEKVTVKGLQGSDALTKIEVDGQGKEVGEYALIPNAAAIGNATDNYDITYVNGTLTITKAKPKPTPPQPQTETAKVAPKAMTAKGKNALTIHWRKVSGAQGYDIFFSICGKDTRCKLTKTIKGNSTFSWTKTGLKTKTPYKAYVKGWVMKDGKKKYISTSPTLHLYTANGTNNYTVAKSIKVKKAKVKLNVGKKYKIKAKIIKRDKTKKLMPATHTKQLRYISTNKKVATVSKSGKIKAKGKGSCKIYVYAANGVSKAVKVTVK